MERWTWRGWSAGLWNRPISISAPGLFPPGAGIAAPNQFGLSHQTDVFIFDASIGGHRSSGVGCGLAGPEAVTTAGRITIRYRFLALRFVRQRERCIDLGRVDPLSGFRTDVSAVLR
jgi:hypothetical protein